MANFHFDFKEKSFPIKNTSYLIAGGVSGIQNYIYSIVSKQASKALKGRSFYVQLLVDGVLRYTLNELGLNYQTHVIHASGGGFLLLSDQDPGERLTALHQKINQALFETHGAQLFFTLDTVPLRNEKELGAALRKVYADKLDTQKQQKFRGLIEADFTRLFAPQDAGGTALRDAVTGEEIRGKAYQRDEESGKLFGAKKEAANDDGTDYFSEITKTQIELGDQLRHTDLLVFSPQKRIRFSVKPDKQPLQHNLLGLGMYVALLKAGEESKLDFAGLPEGSELVFWNQEDKEAIEKYRTEADTYYLTHGFYGGNDIPRILLQDRKELLKPFPKTFSELAEAADPQRQADYRGEDGNPPKWFYPEDFKEADFKRLAVLRMDVDNLGTLFQEQKSLEDYHKLSSQLDFFFAGYLNEIWKKNFKDHSQIIYSGGDDLFIVGRWDVLIDFAVRIRKDFTLFCEDKEIQKDGIGLSGGLTMAPPKAPLIRLAGQAGEAEKAAKGHKVCFKKEEDDQKETKEKSKCPEGYKKQEKDAFTLFGVPLNWSDEKSEFALVKKWKDELVAFVGKNDNAKGLLRRVGSYYEQAKAQQASGENPAWRWRLAYNLARYAEGKSTQKEFLNTLKNAIFTNTYEGFESLKPQENDDLYFFRLLRVAARWAQLELRAQAKNTKSP